MTGTPLKDYTSKLMRDSIINNPNLYDAFNGSLERIIKTWDSFEGDEDKKKQAVIASNVEPDNLLVASAAAFIIQYDGNQNYYHETIFKIVQSYHQNKVFGEDTQKVVADCYRNMENYPPAQQELKKMGLNQKNPNSAPARPHMADKSGCNTKCNIL